MNKILSWVTAACITASTALISTEIQEPIPAIQSFIGEMIPELQKHGIDPASLRVDHLTYLAANIEEYLALEKQLKEEGNDAFTNLVFAKRAQTASELLQPLHIGGYVIPIVELASPWPKSTNAGRVEQIKLIVPTTVTEFVAKYPNAPWNLLNLHRPVNPEALLETKFGIMRFRQMGLKEMVAGRKKLDPPDLIAAGAVALIPAIMTDQQRANLVDEKGGELPFSELAVGSWKFTPQNIIQPSEQMLNKDKAINVFCVSGKVKLELGNIAFTLSPGDTIQVPPGIVYRYVPIDNYTPRLLVVELQ